MILDKGALAIRFAAADPEERPGALSCVLIEAGVSGDSARLIATDGHFMVAVLSEAQRDLFDESEGFPLPVGWLPLGRALIPAAMFEQVDKALPKVEKPRVSAVRDGSDIVFVGPDGLDAGRATVKGKRPEEDLEFPKYVSILGMAEKKPVVTFALNFDLLAKVAKIAKACGAGGFLTFAFHGPGKPVVVRPVGNERVIAVVMPAKGDEDTSVPSKAVEDTARIAEDEERGKHAEGVDPAHSQEESEGVHAHRGEVQEGQDGG